MAFADQQVLWSSETTKSKGHQFRASWEIRVFLRLELLTNKWHLSFHNIQVQNLPSSLLCNKSIFARNLENFSNFVHHQIISCKNVWKKRSNDKKITVNCRSCLKCNTFLISISFVALFHSRLEPLKLKKWYTIQCNSESCVSQFLLVKVSINHRPLSKSSAYQIPTTSILNHNTQKFNTQLCHFCWNTDETLTFLKLF